MGFHGSGMRVEGIWLQTDPALQLARAGYWHHEDIEIPPETAYLLSFHYRTEEMGSAAATLWASEDSSLFQSGDYWLPGTNGRWRAVFVLLRNQTEQIGRLRPLLRNWGSGSVWFDEVEVKEISSSSNSKPNGNSNLLIVR